jgi:Delta7-sterol 5-desaturase
MEYFDWLGTRWLQIILKATYTLTPMLIVFWVWKPDWLAKYRIRQPREEKPRYLTELPATILGLSVYLIPLFTLMILKTKYGYTRMYLDVSEYGFAYFVFSFILFALITDTWFFWIHLGMHRISWLKPIHQWHHRSYNITPLTSYSFHLGEALLNMASYAFFVLVIPFHPSVLAFFGFFGIIYNGYVHLGYDIPQAWREKLPFLKWFYSSRQHSIHHHEYNHNFAVYFTFWDRLMKTEKLVAK